MIKKYHIKRQIKYLNETMGNMKVDHDLQLEKVKKEDLTQIKSLVGKWGDLVGVKA